MYNLVKGRFVIAPVVTRYPMVQFPHRKGGAVSAGISGDFFYLFLEFRCVADSTGIVSP